MEILSRNYALPQNTKLVNQNRMQNAKLQLYPSFKSNKSKLGEVLGKEILDSVNLSSQGIKEILSNPEKRKTFMEVLGATVVSIAAALTEILVGNSDSEKEVSQGAVSEEGDADENNSVVSLVAEENSVTTNVTSQASVPDEKVDVNADSEVVKISEEIQAVLKKYPNIKTQYEAIIANSENNEETIARLESINKFLKPEIEVLESKTLNKALSRINKYFSENLEKISKICEKFNEEDTEKFYLMASYNDGLAPDAIENYDFSLKNIGIDFFQFNMYKKANMSNDDIKELQSFINKIYVNEVEIDYSSNDFNIKMPWNKSLSQDFEVLMKVFELIKDEEVSLEAEENTRMTEEKIVLELKKDFTRYNRVSYKNIVAYLYGKKHEVHSPYALDKHKNDKKFEFLVDLLNDDKLFNPNLFSNHAKMRFIERFVLNEDLNYKSLYDVTQEKIATFIKELKSALIKGVNINSYYAGDYGDKIGIQLTIPSKKYNKIKITLDNKGKIHTIL